MAYSCPHLPSRHFLLDTVWSTWAIAEQKTGLETGAGTEQGPKGRESCKGQVQRGKAYPVAGQGPAAHSTLLCKQAAQKGPVLAVPHSFHHVPQLVIPGCLLQQRQCQLCPAPAGECVDCQKPPNQTLQCDSGGGGRSGCHTPRILLFGPPPAPPSEFSSRDLLIWPIPGKGGIRALVPEALMEGLQALALELCQGPSHITTMLKQCLKRPLFRPKAQRPELLHLRIGGGEE